MTDSRKGRMKKYISALATCGLMALSTVSYAATTDFVAAHTEAGFYYGFGSGASEAQAKAEAFDDLVYNLFTESGAIKKERKNRVILTGEMKAAVAAVATRPYTSDSKDKVFKASYRLSHADWAKAESVRLSKLAADLGPKFDAVVKGRGALGGRLSQAIQIDAVIHQAGVPLTLRTGDASSPVLSQTIETWVAAQLAGATVSLSPKDGLVEGGTSFAVTVTTKDGSPVAGLPLSVVWSAAGTSMPAQSIVTDAKGMASFSYPTGDAFKGTRAELTITGDFARKASELTFLASIDAGLKTVAAYRNAEDLAQIASNFVNVSAGTYTVGSVKQDRRAGGNEKPRTVTVSAFAIAKALVTNSQFRAYLEAANVPQDQWPDYFDSDDFSGDDQPVVGVNYEQAVSYAAWLSAATGEKFRLPTEDEYEIAARAGQSSIYPWGDQAPTDGVRANYSGNKKFAKPSPPGAFSGGNNPLGLSDMVGNVWQWTSTSPDANMSADPSYKIVKGGSWMDGPNELRISNRRAVDPSEGASDIGFRVVREATQ